MVKIAGSVGSVLTHMAALGFAAIVEDRTGELCRIEARPNGFLVHLPDNLNPMAAAEVVSRHARARTESWVTATCTVGNSTIGVMSPRGPAPADRAAWAESSGERKRLYDAAYASPTAWLDLEFMAALGEPAYWASDKDGKPRLDFGASAWEMKTRNRGEDFISNRLALLCDAVAKREPADVLAGLNGDRRRDEVGSGSVTSRTPTGLSAPGPTDNALAWCALWGISQFPVMHRALSSRGSRQGTGSRSVTTGMLRGLHRGSNVRAHVYLPVFDRAVRTSRYRTVASSAQLARRAALIVLAPDGRAGRVGDTDQVRDRRAELDGASDVHWLIEKGCAGVLLAPQLASDNINAPELHISSGVVHSLGN